MWKTWINFNIYWQKCDEAWENGCYSPRKKCIQELFLLHIFIMEQLSKVKKKTHKTKRPVFKTKMKKWKSVEPAIFNSSANLVHGFLFFEVWRQFFNCCKQNLPFALANDFFFHLSSIAFIFHSYCNEIVYFNIPWPHFLCLVMYH